MNRLTRYAFGLCAAVFLASCEGRQLSVQEPLAENNDFLNDDFKLAEAVVKAKPYFFRYSRDPFMPLENKGGGKPNASAGRALDTRDTAEVFLHGIISSGGVAFAVLENGGKTKLYRARETVGAYTVEAVEAKGVILKQGSNQLELKVGGQLKK